MARSDSLFWLSYSLSPLSVSCSLTLCPGKKYNTAENCCSSVKYGETAWRISLPLITKARRESLIISLCAFPVYPSPQMVLPVLHRGALTLLFHHPRFPWPFCDSIDIELSFTFNRHMHCGTDGWSDGWMTRVMATTQLFGKTKRNFSGNGKKLMMLAGRSADRLRWV